MKTEKLLFIQWVFLHHESLNHWQCLNFYIDWYLIPIYQLVYVGFDFYYTVDECFYLDIKLMYTFHFYTYM